MANRYWRGGTGTWSTTTTNWSATSGGLGGASAPTAADSVIFDQAGPYTVTLTGALTCLDITVSVGVVTFATGTTPTLAVSGSMSLLAGTVWTATGTITFNATSTGKTISTNATSMPCGVTFNGVGGGWTLGSAFVRDATAANVTLTNGTLSLGSFAFTTGYTVSYNGGSITATAGTGTMKCTSFTLNNPGGLSLPFGGFAGANLTCTTGFTHTSGNLAVTATTNLGYQSASINTCVYTYNPPTSGNITLSSSVVLTVGQFTVPGASTGTRVIAFGAGGTIDLAHSTAATAVLNIGGSVTGLSYTGTGAYGFTSSMNFNGSAITRTFTSGSALTAVNFPLAITGGSGVITFTTSSYFSILSFGTWSGTIAATATTYITTSATLNGTGNFTNLTLSTTSNTPGNVTITGSTSTTLTGVTHNNVGYTLTLGSNLTLSSTGTFTLTAGTLLLNTYTLSCWVFSSSGSTARAITFGATNIVINSASVGAGVGMAAADNFTWTGTTGNEGFQTAMSTGKGWLSGARWGVRPCWRGIFPRHCTHGAGHPRWG